MSMNIQKHIRTAFYHLPIHCGFCGQRVLSAEDEHEPVIAACRHTLYVAHQEGYEYVSERVKDQLRGFGYEIDDADSLISIFKPASVEDESLDPYELAETIKFPDGIEINAVVGPPSGFTTYVGFAPCEDE